MSMERTTNVNEIETITKKVEVLVGRAGTIENMMGEIDARLFGPSPTAQNGDKEMESPSINANLDKIGVFMDSIGNYADKMLQKL